MPEYTLTARRAIAAPASVAYRVIADYETHHPRIVPPAFFRNFQVERGGYGAGTIVRFDAMVLGRAHPMRSEITEPEPGRVLVERDMDRGTVTTFTVEPRDGGRTCEVTFHTVMRDRGGILGALERAMMKRLLPKMYAEELGRLDAYARELATEASPAPA